MSDQQEVPRRLRRFYRQGETPPQQQQSYSNQMPEQKYQSRPYTPPRQEQNTDKQFPLFGRQKPISEERPARQFERRREAQAPVRVVEKQIPPMEEKKSAPSVNDLIQNLKQLVKPEEKIESKRLPAGQPSSLPKYKSEIEVMSENLFESAKEFANQNSAPVNPFPKPSPQTSNDLPRSRLQERLESRRKAREVTAQQQQQSSPSQPSAQSKPQATTAAKSSPPQPAFKSQHLRRRAGLDLPSEQEKEEKEDTSEDEDEMDVKDLLKEDDEKESDELEDDDNDLDEDEELDEEGEEEKLDDDLEELEDMDEDEAVKKKKKKAAL